MVDSAQRRLTGSALTDRTNSLSFGASSDNIPLFVSHMTPTFTIQNIPTGLRALARVLMQRDGIDAFDAWHDVISPALDDLNARLDAAVDDNADGFIDEADFMQEHFGLKPDYFMDILDHIAS